MARNANSARSTLNDLLETCKSGVEGFRAAAEKVKAAETQRLFLTFSLQREQFAQALEAEILRMGGEPAKARPKKTAIHRGWLNLKSAIAGDNDYSILEEAERSEEAAVKNYREALDRELPPELRAVIDKQYWEIRHTHDEVRTLRDRAGRMTMPMAGLT